MRDVDGPKEPDLMVPPVEPVVKEVFSEQQQEPIRENVRDRYPVMVIADLEDQQIDAAEQKVDEAVQEHQVNIIECIFKGIEFPMPVIAEQDLQPDDDKI